MRLTALLAFLTVLALAFAGCSTKAKDNGGASSSTTSSHSSSSSSSSSGSRSSSSTSHSSSSSSSGPAANHAPTGSISAAINGTNATFSLTGTDADHDALVWDLAFGDGAAANGTALPATVHHAYAAVGNFSANFTVTDGRAPVSYNVRVKIVGAADGAAVQDIDAGWQAAYNPGCADGAVPYDAVPGTEGVTFASASVEPGTVGKAFTAVFDSGALLDYVRFVDAGGATLLQVATGGAALAWTATGTVPDASATVAFFGCFGLPGEHVVYHAG